MLEDQRTLTGGGESVFCIEREPQYYNRWKTYCKTHGLTPISLYELRHTFVSVIKTLPAGTVKPLVGHSQDMDTFGVCAHALPARENAPQPQPMICFKTCWAMNPRAPCEAF